MIGGCCYCCCCCLETRTTTTTTKGSNYSYFDPTNSLLDPVTHQGKGEMIVLTVAAMIILMLVAAVFAEQLG
jgi:hypothetical protein